MLHEVTRMAVAARLGMTRVMVTLCGAWVTRTAMQRTAIMLRTDLTVTGSLAMVIRVTQTERTVVSTSDQRRRPRLARHTEYTSSAHAWYRHEAIRCAVNTMHSA